jgi:hypothetical protein
MAARARSEEKAGGAPLGDKRVEQALRRLSKRWALHVLVRGALPVKTVGRLLRGAFSARTMRELPEEALAGLVASIAFADADFARIVCLELNDRLAWDNEPASLDAWWAPVRERPLEALWMAAMSSSREVRKEFDHILDHCLDNYRNSPECLQPSWDFVEGNLEVHAATARDLQEAIRTAEDAERRLETERQRLDELRDELKRLRREAAELRREHAQTRRLLDDARRSPGPAAPTAADVGRVAELEQALRKADKENEHLRRRLERDNGDAETPPAPVAPAPDILAPRRPQPPLSQDPNPRRRVLRQMLRKLYKKGKIGASHTHEDNVFRGVPDHDKGVAKELMDLLYRDGFLVPKPTVADPHVSLSSERIEEVKEMISGRIASARLKRYLAQA